MYIPGTNEVFFTSNRADAPSGQPYPFYGNFSKISLTPDSSGKYSWEVLKPPSPSFVLPNGGTIYNDKVLMAIQGYQLNVASSLIAVDPKTLEATVLLNNFYGRPFNSINDVAVLMKSGGEKTDLQRQWIFFTGEI